MSAICGILPALPTPFRPGHWELDLPALKQIVRYLVERGVHGFVVAGTTGEGPSMSVSERLATLTAVVEVAEGRPVILGTATSSVTEAVELAHQGERCGASGLLAIPPFYYKSPPVEGLSRFYQRVLESTRLPVILYNCPQLSAVTISDTLLQGLASQPNLLGIKDSGGDRHRLLEYRRRFPNLAIFGGADELADFALESGAVGCISTMANLFPELMVALYKARSQKRADRAASAQLDRGRQVLYRYGLQPAVKFGLSLLGMPVSTVRPPLEELTERQRELFTQELARIGIGAGAKSR